MARLSNFLGFAVGAAIAANLLANDLEPVKLPAPRSDGGKPLMQALKERKSTRAFSSKELSLQQLSDLLWAANGINRPATGHRTAPSARNSQEIDIYVVMAKGAYIYNAKSNVLEPVVEGDLRAKMGRQQFVREAPVVLVFVANYDRFGNMAESDKAFYAATDTGYVSQNVYLYCASEGLATVVLGNIDRNGIAEALKLGANQKVVLTQPVGYPR
jgi:SagB-type dehydrogenase family enzyme